MKNKILLVLVVFIAGCASKKPKSDLHKEPTTTKSMNVNIDLIATDMASLNSRMRVRLIRKEKYKNFNSFESSMYLKKAHEYQDPSEIDYIDYLGADDMEIVTKGRNLNFVVCTRSLKFKFVLCDKANSILIDFVSKDLSVDINKKTDLLLVD